MAISWNTGKSILVNRWVIWILVHKYLKIWYVKFVTINVGCCSYYVSCVRQKFPLNLFSVTMPKTHHARKPVNARLLSEFFHSVIVVELREARDSAHPNPETNAETALVPRFRWCSSLNRFTLLCYLVELLKATPSAYPSPTFNAENALKARPR